MHGQAKLLIQYLNSADKLIIPVYQRNYDWKEQHCRRLFDDLIKVVTEDRLHHFFGSIVSVDNVMGGTSEYLVIDGQQRITTVSLLLLAMVNLMKEKIIHCYEDDFCERIEKKYLIDEFQDKKQKIRLKPMKGDREALELLWGNKDDYDYSSNVTNNYLYFYNRLQQKEISLEDMYNAITRLQIIDISLNAETDDAQLIFESLNSTGLELNEGDKIRNFILMGLSFQKQESYYQKYWAKIEKLAGQMHGINNYDVTSFIRDYLSIKQRSIPAMKQVYFRFKDYAQAYKKGNFELLLNDMLIYARRYHKLLEGDNSYHWKLNASIYRLNRLDSSVIKPFLLEVIHKLEDNIVSSEEAIEIFCLVETYLFRRMICDLPSNALNKVFLNLDYEVKKMDDTFDCYVDKLKYILANKKEKARFPDDIEFIEKLRNKNIYFMSYKYKAYLFDRLENGDSLEYKSIYSHLDKGDYSIEHIMPQTLNSAWKRDLGNEWEELHNGWLNRLANLTLTAYNSKYRNQTFLEKRNCKNGFLDSGLKLNQRIALKTSWGRAELEERDVYLAQKSLSLWSYAKTTYVPVQKQFDIFTLDDEINFTGKRIVKFQFHDLEQFVSNWTELYQCILFELHQHNKSVLYQLADANESVELASHVTRDKNKFASYCKIEENLFVWTRNSTQYKMNLLLKFFKLYNEEPNELVLYVHSFVQ